MGPTALQVQTWGWLLAALAPESDGWVRAFDSLIAPHFLLQVTEVCSLLNQPPPKQSWTRGTVADFSGTLSEKSKLWGGSRNPRCIRMENPSPEGDRPACPPSAPGTGAGKSPPSSEGRRGKKNARKGPSGAVRGGGGVCRLERHSCPGAGRLGSGDKSRLGNASVFF